MPPVRPGDLLRSPTEKRRKDPREDCTVQPGHCSRGITVVCQDAKAQSQRQRNHCGGQTSDEITLEVVEGKAKIFRVVEILKIVPEIDLKTLS
jgi:hypothetical protein